MLMEECGGETEGGEMRSGMGQGQTDSQKDIVVMETS